MCVFAVFFRLSTNSSLSLPLVSCKMLNTCSKAPRVPQTKAFFLVSFNFLRHDKAVEHSGFCPAYRRAKSPYESQLAVKG
jgi:hypothetical protein